MYENSELKVLKNINFSGEISNNWPKEFSEKVCTALSKYIDNHCWQYYNGLTLLQ